MITTSDRRRRIPSAARSAAPRSVVPGAGAAGRSSRERIRSTWLRPDAGGIVSRTPCVEQQRADPVPAAREQLRHGGRDLGEHDVLVPLHRPEVHRRGEVEQQPGGDLAVFGVLAHVRDVGARGDVPVDVAQVVAELVLAQVRDVDAGAAEHRPVVALQASVQTPQHPPLEAAQHTFGRERRQFRHGRRAEAPRPGWSGPVWSSSAWSSSGRGIAARSGPSTSSGETSSARAS